jgi:hypothetical protein
LVLPPGGTAGGPEELREGGNAATPTTPEACDGSLRPRSRIGSTFIEANTMKVN